MSTVSLRGQGRVHPGQRGGHANRNNNENNNTETITATTTTTVQFDILPEHVSEIALTVDHSEKKATRQDYRNRLQRMVDWCVVTYPDFAAYAICPISEEEKNESTKHFHKQTADFNYERLNSEIIRAYLSTIRKERADGTGKTRSFSHVRKFYDAILFGAREQGSVLTQKFHQEIELYLKSFKKESIVAKRCGETEENDSDPMPLPLYTAICTWFVLESDIYSWTFLVLMWNCMARGASIDPLGLHNIKLGTDSIIITYDDSKMDGTGERTHPKNCYANPTNPNICIFLALSIYFSLYPEQYDNNDSLFLKAESKLGTASHRFTMHLKAIVKKYSSTVSKWVVPDRLRSHSGRKGAATYLTAATLNPPPLSSVAHRGEWSQGKIQDIYFSFAKPGDHYVGRMLAGLDSTSSQFKILPPHFTCDSSHPDLIEGISLCYGQLLRKNKNLKHLSGLVQMLLASLIYHEDFVHAFTRVNKKHAFTNLVIFENLELVKRLRSMITINPSAIIPGPTGIPTHIEMTSKMDTLLNNNIEFLEEIKKQSTVIREAVKTAIEENDLMSGQVTMPILSKLLDERYQTLVEIIKANNNLLSTGTRGPSQNQKTVDCSVEMDDKFSSSFSTKGSPVYCYSGRFWDVPEGWTFQKYPTRRIGWVYWLKGQCGINMQAPVKPYRKLILGRLPLNQRNAYMSTWRPVFDMMMECPDLNIPSDFEYITALIIDESFNKATIYMKGKVSYIWTLQKKKDLENWSISTWSRHLSFGYIKKYGTEKDKSYLPLPTYRQKRKGTQQKNTITPMDISFFPTDIVAENTSDQTCTLMENTSTTHAESTLNSINNTAGTRGADDLESESTDSSIDYGVRPSDTFVDYEELAPTEPTTHVLTTLNLAGNINEGLSRKKRRNH